MIGKPLIFQAIEAGVTFASLSPIATRVVSEHMRNGALVTRAVNEFILANPECDPRSE